MPVGDKFGGGADRGMLSCRKRSRKTLPINLRCVVVQAPWDDGLAFKLGLSRHFHMSIFGQCGDTNTLLDVAASLVLVFERRPVHGLYLLCFSVRKSGKFIFPSAFG